MRFSKAFIAAAAAFFALAEAAPVEKRGVLAVDLKEVDHATVKAVITNTGSEDLKLLKYGTILDDKANARKVAVVKDGKVVSFEGILYNYLLTNLPEDAFVTIPAGESYETDVNVANNHDLTTSGLYELAAAGAIPIAKTGTNELSQDVHFFESNTLKVDVDGAKVAKVERRTTVQTSSCSTSQLSALRTALSNSASLASAAATAATSGSATKFSEYFKTTATATRSTVAARLRGVVTQSSSTTSGGTRYYCTDFYGACSSNVLAYTLPSTNQIANCPIYYSALPALTRTCHAQDQATTTLHEFTHAPATYSPGTADNGYGYAAATALTSARAVLNADSYALYANAIYVGC